MSMTGCRLYGQANGDLLQEDLCQQATPPRTAAACAPDPAAGHCQPTPLPETLKHSQASLPWSLVGSQLLSHESWCAQNFICSVQLLSHVRLFATPWTVECHASLSITTSWRLLKLMSIESVMLSNCLILCCTLLPSSAFHSIRVFSNESVLHIRWTEYWSFSFSISPTNEYSGLISFRMDCLDLLAVQGTFKSLLQHPNSKASIPRRSTFFIVHT